MGVDWGVEYGAREVKGEPMKSIINLVAKADEPAAKCGRCKHELKLTCGGSAGEPPSIEGRIGLLLGWLNGHKCVRSEDEE